MNESQGNAMASESLSNSLLQVNKMLYKMPPSLGITARRHHVIDFSQQNGYSNGQTMVFDLQTGSYFIDGKNSYLRLDVTIASTANGNYRSGGVSNLIKRVVIRTKSGKEWCRCEEFNLYVRNCLRYKCTENYINRTGKSYGFGSDSTATNQSSQANGVTYRWTLPLWLIPCFNQDKLLPPQIMEGLRIELTLEDPAVAFESTGAVNSYTVTNAEIHSDAFDIADQFKRKVAEMSARQGLILVHKEYFHSNVGTIAESTSYNFDIKKACSKACRNFTVLRLEANSTGASRQSADSLNAEVYKVSRYQAHVGQDYMPNQPIDVPLDSGTNLPAIQGINEAYYDTQFVWDKVNQCWYPNTVTPEQFLGDADVTGANCGMVAFNLNKSHVTDLDGYVLNNSRALVVDIKCAGDAVARKLDTYLEHLRVAKVYTANAEIRD
jgi:hypothetical protein